jgi:hypothetical protein
MTLGPRGKMALIVTGFALPIVASFLVYTYGNPRPTANYGELLLPPDTITTADFATAAGQPFRFASLAGRWVMLAADAPDCDAACRAKLVAMRQVRLALGKDAERVATVTVLEGDAPAWRAEFPDMAFVRPRKPTPAGAPTADRAHIYLVDPNGNVMMRWPARPDYKRMKGDLDRLLRASQIGQGPAPAIMNGLALSAPKGLSEAHGPIA